MATPASIPSKYIIVQFAARALRRVHLDWQLFNLGQEGKSEDDVRGLNVGWGFEAALETTVAAAFAQEFNSSKVAHGWLSPLHDDEARYFVVDREVGFSWPAPKDKRIVVDVVIRRIGEFGILPLELKRARRYTADLAKGALKACESNVASVAWDIAKMCDFAKTWKANGFDTTEERSEYVAFRFAPYDVFPHLLVWGVYEPSKDDKKAPSPVTFLEKAFAHAKAQGQAGKTNSKLAEWIPAADVEQVLPAYIEWVPLDWEKGSAASAPAAVSKWAWIAYAEIDPDPAATAAAKAIKAAPGPAKS